MISITALRQDSDSLPSLTVLLTVFVCCCFFFFLSFFVFLAGVTHSLSGVSVLCARPRLVFVLPSENRPTLRPLLPPAERRRRVPGTDPHPQPHHQPLGWLHHLLLQPSGTSSAPLPPGLQGLPHTQPGLRRARPWLQQPRGGEHASASPSSTTSSLATATATSTASSSSFPGPSGHDGYCPQHQHGCHRGHVGLQGYQRGGPGVGATAPQETLVGP